MMGDWPWGGGFGLWGLVGTLLMLGFWAMIIVGVVLVIRSLSGRGDQPPGQTYNPAATGRSRALEILEERYARGEIDRDEFLHRKADLQEGPTRAAPH